MGFDQFLGNRNIVAALRRMLARERVPHAMLFAGPRGVGRYTLAVMFAQAANCERLRDDFCGECPPCRAIAKLADPVPLIEQGLAERGENPDAATVERIPLILQTHPDVWALVPDPVRRGRPAARPVIRMGQLRAAQRAAYFAPTARRRVFILDSAETMRWDYANIFLKILEEPPGTATFILLAPRPDDLLPTIRSRAVTFRFSPLPVEEVEKFLNARTSLTAAQRRLAAQLSAGSPGAALGLDLEESARLRGQVVRMLELAVEGKSWHEMFSASEQLAKLESEKFENVLELFYSACTDLLEYCCGLEEGIPRNPDLQDRLEGLGRKVTPDWIRGVVDTLDRLSTGLRRNINRQLGLDAAAVSWALGATGGPPSRSGRARQ
jgi:DNA polymerase III subunit delta'